MSIDVSVRRLHLPRGNRNDDIVWSKQINGDDYFSIDFQNMNNGLYRLKLLGKMKNNRDIDYSEAKDSDYSIVTYKIHLKVNEWQNLLNQLQLCSLYAFKLYFKHYWWIKEIILKLEIEFFIHEYVKC